MNLFISISIFSSLNAIYAVELCLEALQSLCSSIHTASLVTLFSQELFSCYSSLPPLDNLCIFFVTLNLRHQFWLFSLIFSLTFWIMHYSAYLSTTGINFLFNWDPNWSWIDCNCHKFINLSDVSLSSNSGTWMDVWIYLWQFRYPFLFLDPFSSSLWSH